MLKQQYQKLRFCSKGNLKRWGCQTIPVLSTFALLGMNMMLFGLFYDEVPETYAAGSVGSDTSASLIIDNGNIVDKISATHGETAYASHVVKVSASNITDYALTITGPTSLTGTSTINGASGATGANLSDNTWGYAWDVANKAEADMTYNSFTGSAQTLTGNPAVNNNAVDFERKLAFAAKFSQDAVEGHYTASVNLNLVATPYIVVGIWNTNGATKDSGITYMDQMTETVCNQVSTPVVGTLPHSVPTMALKDRRDGKTYRVARLTDGKCWMIDNLALDLSVAGIASKDYSDNLSANYPTTALVSRFDTKLTNVWENDNTKEQFSKTPALINATYPGDGNGYQSEYGYYYSWCAATAGCKTSTGANPGKNEDAAGSICPKGWKLPNGKTNSYANNDFIGLMQKTNYNGWNGSSLVTEANFPVADFAAKYVAATQLRTTDVVPATLYLGGADWYRAGDIFSNGLFNPGSYMAYWSRTAGSGTGAYTLNLDSDSNGSLRPASGNNRYNGFSVRCVADIEHTYTLTYEYSGDYNTGLPEPQTVHILDETYTFTIPSSVFVLHDYGNGSASGGPVTSWTGSDGKTYKPGDSITVTKDNPNFTLTIKGVDNSYSIA